MQLMFGHPDYFLTPSYGVVDDEDPTSATAGGGRPLAVSANLENQLNVDINAGLGVTKSGMWMLLPEIARNVALEDTNFSIPNVVYLQYILVDGPTEVNDDLVPVVTFFERPEDDDTVAVDFAIGVQTVENYLALDPATLEDRVPLAIVTVSSSVDPDTAVASTVLQIDHTQGTYSWNRPWFSAVDVEHRSKLGSGEQTDSNIHAVGLNEVSVGRWNPISLQIPHGMVVGRAQTVEKVPGYRCTASIPGSEVLVDDGSGTYTGFPNSPYIELPYFPAKVGRVLLQSSSDDYPAIQIKETKRVAFPNNVTPANDTLTAYFTRVEGCEPPPGKNETSFSTNNPVTDEELVLAGGNAHTALASTQETFGDSYQFPMKYVIFVDGDGNLMRTPQVVYCYKKLDTLGTTDTPEIDQYGNAILMMGLVDAAAIGSMVVKIRVYGEDVDGNSIDHLFEFDGASWSDPGPIPNLNVTDAAFKFSTQLFSTITSIEIEERVDDGPNSAIMIWANINPQDTRTQMEDAAVVSEVMWDGLRLATIRDKRIIYTTEREELITSDARMALENHLRIHGGSNFTLYVEDFRAPDIHSLFLPREYETTLPSTRYPWNLMDSLYIGRQGHYLTRGLPVLDNSGFDWRVVLLPESVGEFTFAAPEIRWFVSNAWTDWVTMTAVAGIPQTWERTLGGAVVPTGVQVKLNPGTYYQSQLMAIYG
jgi:hypothetical protein